jgi:hypothetical protein
MIGRPILGAGLVDRLQGSDRAKLIVRTLLETISGQRTIDEAAKVLDCNGAYVHALRERLLTATIAAAEPRPHGPAPKPEIDAVTREAIDTAEARARDAEVALELERCRSELALVFGPRLSRRAFRKKNRTRT